MTIDQAITAVENIPSGGSGDETIVAILSRAQSNAETFNIDFDALGMNHVPDYALEYGAALRKVKLPTSTSTKIGRQAFYMCPNMTLENNNLVCGSIGTHAFNSCDAITLRRIDCTIIQQEAFANCRGINYMALLCSYFIANFAFSGCSNLKKVWISKNCPTIQAAGYTSGPFYNCTSLTDIYTDATENPSGWGNYFDCVNRSMAATVHYGVSEAEFDAIVEAEEAAS